MNAEKNIRTYTDDIQKFRLDDSGNDNGGFSGYGNVKGYLDSHGTIMIDGCYVRSIPSLLKNGFVPDTHGADTNYIPTYKNTLGYFTSAVEDEYGLWVEAEFYDTHRAQEVREQLMERSSNGITNGLSIGFGIPEGTNIRIFPADYEIELPKYVKPEFLQQALSDCVNFAFIDILTEVELMEVSLTVIPSNEASVVVNTRAKNSNLRNNKTMSELRIAKRVSKDTYDKLSAHLDKMEDAHEKLAKHLDDLADEHRAGLKMAKDCGKAMKDMREKLDSLHKDEDDDAHEEPDGDEAPGKGKKDDDKRSLSDLYNLLEEIKNKKN